MVLIGLVFIYVILTGSSSEKGHAKHVDIVFKCLSEYFILINFDKCVLDIQDLSFEGFMYKV